MFAKFAMVMVVVSDMERSLAFYRDALGFELKFQSPAFSQLRVGDVALGLHLAQGDTVRTDPQSGISFGFHTRDLEKTLAELVGRGVTVLRREDNPWIKIAIIADPDGYGIRIGQPLSQQD